MVYFLCFLLGGFRVNYPVILKNRKFLVAMYMYLNVKFINKFMCFLLEYRTQLITTSTMEKNMNQEVEYGYIL